MSFSSAAALLPFHHAPSSHNWNSVAFVLRNAYASAMNLMEILDILLCCLSKLQNSAMRARFAHLQSFEKDTSNLDNFDWWNDKYLYGARNCVSTGRDYSDGFIFCRQQRRVMSSQIFLHEEWECRKKLQLFIVYVGSFFFYNSIQISNSLLYLWSLL